MADEKVVDEKEGIRRELSTQTNTRFHPKPYIQKVNFMSHE